MSDETKKNQYSADSIQALEGMEGLEGREDPKIEIEAGQNEQGILISVADNGPGIVDIEKAMQAGFSTASDEHREMGFGAGMGLPNMKKNADDITGIFKNFVVLNLCFLRLSILNDDIKNYKEHDKYCRKY